MDNFTSFGICNQLAQNLVDNGYSELFDVQKSVIPTLLSNNSRSCVIPRHILVGSPTGSGKTLSYVIPILQALNRHIASEIRLKAVIILPTRELANQVFHVFCQLAKNMNVLVSIVTGFVSIEREQMMLGSKLINSFIESSDNSKMFSSNADILVCTPGRLQDHLQLTPGFTLKYLQFLVLDEADRLLGNAYHNWVKMLIQATDTTQLDILSQSTSKRYDFNQMLGHSKDCMSSSYNIDSRSSCHFQRLLFSATLTDNPGKLFLLGVRNPLILKFGGENSTPAPAAHSSGVSISEKGPVLDAPMPNQAVYFLPNLLSESICMCETARRPLALASLLYEATNRVLNDADTKKKTDTYTDLGNSCAAQGSMIIIFTSSVATTTKLCKLLQLINNQIVDSQNKSNVDHDTQSDSNATKKRRLECSSSRYLFNGEVAEISRAVKAHVRDEIVDKCKNGSIKILVSTDQMARGIDLPNVKLVFNYDCTFDSKTYLHRVGRTARGSSSGHAISMLKIGQMSMFKKMHSYFQHSSTEVGSDSTILKTKTNKQIESNVMTHYKKALKLLPLALADETNRFTKQ